MLALLRMKLRGPDVLRVHDGGKFQLVICRGQDDISRGLRVIRMYEVDEARFPNALRQTVLLHEVQLVPAHVRYTQMGGKLHDVALQQIQSMMLSELLALAEQKMHAETDSKSRCSGPHFIDERLSKAQLIQVPHSV